MRWTLINIFFHSTAERESTFYGDKLKKFVDCDFTPREHLWNKIKNSIRIYCVNQYFIEIYQLEIIFRSLSVPKDVKRFPMIFEHACAVYHTHNIFFAYTSRNSISHFSRLSLPHHHSRLRLLLLSWEIGFYLKTSSHSRLL